MVQKKINKIVLSVICFSFITPFAYAFDDCSLKVALKDAELHDIIINYKEEIKKLESTLEGLDKKHIKQYTQKILKENKDLKLKNKVLLEEIKNLKKEDYSCLNIKFYIEKVELSGHSLYIDGIGNVRATMVNDYIVVKALKNSVEYDNFKYLKKMQKDFYENKEAAYIVINKNFLKASVRDKDEKDISKISDYSNIE